MSQQETTSPENPAGASPAGPSPTQLSAHAVKAIAEAKKKFNSVLEDDVRAMQEACMGACPVLQGCGSARLPDPHACIACRCMHRVKHWRNSKP